jgi:hypothetical protein
MDRPDGSARDDAKVSADGTARSIWLRRRAPALSAALIDCYCGKEAAWA